jgi:hypothetical protein
MVVDGDQIKGSPMKLYAPVGEVIAQGGVTVMGFSKSRVGVYKNDLPTINSTSIRPVITQTLDQGSTRSFAVTAFVPTVGSAYDRTEWAVYADSELSVLYFKVVNTTNQLGPVELPHGKIYVTARHIDNEVRYTPWADVLELDIVNANSIPPAPTIISVTKTGSVSYRVTWSEMGGVLNLFQCCDIEVVEGYGGLGGNPVLLIGSYRDTVNRTTINLQNIPGRKPYVRVRYRTFGGQIGAYSDWFMIDEVEPFAPPTILTDHTLEPIPTIEASAFVPTGVVAYKHLNSSWYLYRDPGATDLVASAVASVGQKTSWTLNEPLVGGNYYVQVAYQGGIKLPNKPTISLPVPGAVVGVRPTVVCSAMNDLTIYGDSYGSTEFLLTSITTASVYTHVRAVSNSYTFGSALPSGVYSIKARHRTNGGALSDWSEPVQFTVNKN